MSVNPIQLDLQPPSMHSSTSAPFPFHFYDVFHVWQMQSHNSPFVVGHLMDLRRRKLVGLFDCSFSDIRVCGGFHPSTKRKSALPPVACSVSFIEEAENDEPLTVPVWETPCWSKFMILARTRTSAVGLSESRSTAASWGSSSTKIGSSFVPNGKSG